MKRLHTSCFFTLLLLTFSAVGQTPLERIGHGKTGAEQELKAALVDRKEHSATDNKGLLIKDSLSAIDSAEAILFDIYGKSIVLKQRPYQIYFIDHYWILSGTAPTNHLGKTFLIIIDALDAEIVRLVYDY